MNLSQLYQQRSSFDKKQTDKGTVHNYIDGYYNQKFTPLQHESINLLEIGVKRGYSVSLWREFFSRAMIYGIDNSKKNGGVCHALSNVKFYNEDGYCQKTLDMFEDNFFDFIIDDGPHTLKSQIYAAKEWTKKLKVGGTLVIEDIQKEDSIPLIQSATPSNFEFVLHDLRKDKNRYDDIIIEFIRRY